MCSSIFFFNNRTQFPDSSENIKYSIMLWLCWLCSNHLSPKHLLLVYSLLASIQSCFFLFNHALPTEDFSVFAEEVSVSFPIPRNKSYKRAKMKIGAGIVSLTNGKLMVSGQCVLSDVHDNISLTPVVSNDDVLCDGAFIGVKSDHKGSLRVFPVGKLL